MDKTSLLKIFSKAFDDASWLEVLKAVFGAKLGLLAQPKPILLNKEDKVYGAYELGSFTTTDDRIIGFYKIEVKPEVWLERNKVGLRELLRNVYKYDVDGAIIVFTQQDKWRLSFVSEIKVLNDEGEIVEQATEPKRYTYLLGEGEKVRTPAERLSKLSGKPLTLQDILEAFSVEVLNEEFYKIIQEYFYKLVGGKVGKGKKMKDYGEGILQLPSVPKQNRQVYQEFAVRLIGRTVFCWFLKMKKSDEGIPLLPEGLLSSKAVKEHGNYYHSVLERVFFQMLNTPIEQRVDNLPEGSEQIPFLNGGLFEPDIDDYYKPNKITGLSENLNTLVIENQWFEEFFAELEKYNFTIDENSVTDVEVSVDPEMLGRIFENLLAEIDPDSGETARKATGSFYTPREIVDYMATESLVQYLHNKTQLPQEQLRPIFKMTDNKEFNFADTEREAILDALDKVKVLDPACGSGAFPMGVLQKIVQALQKLDPEATWWIERQVNHNTHPSARKAVREKLQQNPEYARKIGVIQNSLYGVDIQPVAAEISKLRCFLTLIVDENISDNALNRGIEPLPNLEFKFVTANTLIKLPTERDYGGLFNANDDLAELETIRAEYLQSFGEQKIRLKEKFKQIQNKIIKQQISLGQKVDVNSRVYKLSTWNPFSHEKADWFDPKWMFGVEKFDVVIGNPPYLRIQGIRKTDSQFADELVAEYEAATGSFDLYVLFVEKGMEIAQENGVLNFIMPVKWTNSAFGKGLRKYIAKQKAAFKIISFEAYQVFNASTYTGLQWFKRNSPNLQYLQLDRDLPNNVELGNFLKQISNDKFNQYLQSDLNEDAWTLTDKQTGLILEKIKQQPLKIKDIFEKIFQGIATSKDSVYFILNAEDNGNTITGYSKELDREISIERGLVKPLLKGDQVHRYEKLKTNNYVIFPYKLVNGKAILYTETEIAQKFPLGYAYLKENEDVLRKRENGRLLNDEFWFRYIYPKNLTLFDKPKLICPDICLGGNYAFDKEGEFYDTTTLYGYILYETIQISYEYFLGLLNSNLVWFFLKKTGSVLANNYFRFMPRYVNEIPVYLPTNSQERSIILIVNKIIEQKSKDEDTTALEQQIDHMVYKLYDLTYEEVKVVDPEFPLSEEAYKNLKLE